MKKPLAGLFLLWVATAAAHPIEGRWQTLDLDSGAPRGEVTLALRDGVLEGRITGGQAKPGESQQTLCSKCPGALKDQPIIGMRNIWGMREKDGVFEGGRLLDPDSGNIYKGTLSLAPDGKSVTVRGYIGLPTFGRSTVWKRLP
jgi:uncharacterized protein (DUF2147 family)